MTERLPPTENLSGSLIAHFARNMEQTERDHAAAKRKGLCPNCGIKTHKISFFKKSPLTNEHVHKGICIPCNAASMGATASSLAAASDSQSVSSKSRASDARLSRATSQSSLDAPKAAELDRLVDAGDWEGVVLACKKFEAEEASVRSGSGSGTSTPSVSKSIRSKLKAWKQGKIRQEVESLVKRVVPEELDNVDEMMQQFKGREEELVETLRTMQERAVAQKARTAGHKAAKQEARRNASSSQDSRSSSQGAGGSQHKQTALERAIESGDWAAVGEAAAWMSDASVSSSQDGESSSQGTDRAQHKRTAWDQKVDTLIVESKAAAEAAAQRNDSSVTSGSTAEIERWAVDEKDLVASNAHRSGEREITIFLNNPNDQLLPLKVVSTDTYAEMKRKIKDEFGIPAHRQRLSHGPGIEMTIDGPKLKRNLKDGAHMKLFCPPEYPCRCLQVRTGTGESFTIDVDPCDTIQIVKSKIQLHKGYAAEQQHLCYNNKTLLDGSLADHDIKNQTTLKLELKPSSDDSNAVGAPNTTNTGPPGSNNVANPAGQKGKGKQTQEISSGCVPLGCSAERVLQWKQMLDHLADQLDPNRKICQYTPIPAQYANDSEARSYHRCLEDSLYTTVTVMQLQSQGLGLPGPGLVSDLIRTPGKAVGAFGGLLVALIGEMIASLVDRRNDVACINKSNCFLGSLPAVDGVFLHQFISKLSAAMVHLQMKRRRCAIIDRKMTEMEVGAMKPASGKPTVVANLRNTFDSWWEAVKERARQAQLLEDSKTTPEAATAVVHSGLITRTLIEHSESIQVIRNEQTPEQIAVFLLQAMDDSSPKGVTSHQSSGENSSSAVASKALADEEESSIDLKQLLKDFAEMKAELDALKREKRSGPSQNTQEQRLRQTLRQAQVLEVGVGASAENLDSTAEGVVHGEAAQVDAARHELFGDHINHYSQVEANRAEVLGIHRERIFGLETEVSDIKDHFVSILDLMDNAKVKGVDKKELAARIERANRILLGDPPACATSVGGDSDFGFEETAGSFQKGGDPP